MLNEQTARNSAVGDGTTTAFAFTFKILTKNDIEVLVDGVTKTVDTDYTVTGMGVSGGGTVTFGTAPADDTIVTLIRKQAPSQLSDYIAGQSFAAEAVERDLDELTMMIQQDRETLSRCLHLPKKETGSEAATVWPTLASRKGTILGFNASTGNPEATTTLPEGSTGVTHGVGEYSITLFQSESARTGHVFHHFDIGERAVASGQIDRVFHVNGSLPNDPDISTQRELHAYSFVLETDHHDANGGDIRGIKGIVRADGGAAGRTANIRAAHLAAEGFNGHAGDLTGLICDITHSDETAGVFNPVGEANGIIAQLGAGCRSAFLARSRAVGKERPSYGYAVATGAQALLPETACFQSHGGGNGDLYRGIRSDTDSAVIFSVDRLARAQARSFYSGRATVADDATVVITPSHATGSSGFIEVWAADTSEAWGKCFYRVSASPLAQSCYEGSLCSFTTGDLAGTTGVDGELTISAKNDGTIEIENRLGASKTICWMFVGPATQQGVTA